MMHRLRLLVCEPLERETTLLLEEELFHDVTMAVLPFVCDRAVDTWAALGEMIAAVTERGQRIEVIIGPCCSGLPALPRELIRELGYVHVHRVESCTDLLIDRKLADSYRGQGRRLLLPGALACWHRRLGAQKSSREEFQERIVGSATQLVLVDTGLDPAGLDYLAELAEMAGVEEAVLPVGLDLYRLFLTRIVLEWRLEEEQGQSKAMLSDAIRRSTDHAMALDLIGNLTQIMTETEAVERILELFTILYVPARSVYVTVVGGEIGAVRVYPEGAAVDVGAMWRRLRQLQGDEATIMTEEGFLLQIEHQEETLGLLEITGMAMPQYKEHYLNLAEIISRVCGLAISNARAYQQMQEAQATIEHMAYHDALTGLPNRVLFNDRFTAALAQAHRHERRLAVLLLDLDRFKAVNDSLGHSAGDLLLREVGRQLSSVLRQGDTIARLGGDEFVILLAEIAHERDVIKVAERVREVFATPFRFDGRELQIGASIGIAVYPDDGRDPDTLLNRADLAMYHVKQHGRSHYQRYTPALREEVRKGSPPVEA